MEVQTVGEITTSTTPSSTDTSSSDSGSLNMAEAVDSIGADLGFGESEGESTASSTDAVEPKPSAEPSAPASKDAAPSVPAASTPSSPVPRTWRPEAAAEWAKVPPVVQAEILKREEDMFRGLEGYKADAGLGKAVAQVLQPYDSVFKQYNLNPLQQISGLLQTHHQLSFGSQAEKMAILNKLVTDYGIVETGEEAPYVDPQVKALREELQTLKSGLQGVHQQREAEVRSSLAKELDAFTKDPANADFETVANDIAVLLQSKQATSLREAYDKAVWLNPVTRAKQVARETAAANEKAKKEADAKAEEVRKATAANIKTRAKPASSTTPLGSMDDTLEAQLARIKARH